MASFIANIKQKTYPSNFGLWRNLSRRILAKPNSAYAILSDLEIKIEKGECIGVVGDNGSGKSTLLRSLADILPYQGSTQYSGKMLCILSHGLGAYDDLSVIRNAELLLQLFGLPIKKAKSLAPEVISWAGLDNQSDRVFSHLSEGQRARLPLSALTAADFSILLLDESLNYVDQSFREKFFALTRDWLKAGKIIILTSHDNSNIERFCTRTIKLPC